MRRVVYNPKLKLKLQVKCSAVKCRGGVTLRGLPTHHLAADNGVAEFFVPGLGSNNYCTVLLDNTLTDSLYMSTAEQQRVEQSSAGKTRAESWLSSCHAVMLGVSDWSAQ